MKKRWLLLIIPVILVLAFILWANNSSPAMEQAVTALASSDELTVLTDQVLYFRPLKEPATTGFIFYPGGKVEPEAYAPLARAVAKSGYPTFIVPMPLNLAVLNYQAATKVIEGHPEVTKWVIGGHSLGGAMAAHYLYKHPNQIAGLVLLASYPPSKDDLSSFNHKVLSISGTLDGLATPEKIAKSRDLLPSDTRWLEIPGGNHSQFGWYGFQSGDHLATISRQEQQKKILQAINMFLEQVSTPESM